MSCEIFAGEHQDKRASSYSMCKQEKRLYKEYSRDKGSPVNKASKHQHHKASTQQWVKGSKESGYRRYSSLALHPVAARVYTKSGGLLHILEHPTDVYQRSSRPPRDTDTIPHSAPAHVTLVLTVIPFNPLSKPPSQCSSK